MAFHFRFAKVKDIRELEEDLAEQRLALARQEEERQVARLQLARTAEHQAHQAFARPRAVGVLSLELDLRNCHDLSQRTDYQQQVRQQAAEQVEEDRQDLIVRMQKAKIMQSLHDRHQQEYQHQDTLEQQNLLDELGGVQYLRKRRLGR